MRKKFCLSLDFFFFLGQELNLPQLNCFTHILVTLHDWERGRKRWSCDCVVCLKACIRGEEKAQASWFDQKQNCLWQIKRQARLGIWEQVKRVEIYSCPVWVFSEHFLLTFSGGNCSSSKRETESQDRSWKVFSLPCFGNRRHPLLNGR